MALLLAYDFAQSIAKHGNFLTVVIKGIEVAAAAGGLDMSGATRSAGMLIAFS